MKDHDVWHSNRSKVRVQTLKKNAFEFSKEINFSIILVLLKYETAQSLTRNSTYKEIQWCIIKYCESENVIEGKELRRNHQKFIQCVCVNIIW